MEKTIKYLLQEAYVDGYNDARETMAKEIEGRIVTWAKFSDGIPLHSNCWKCNTEPLTSTCDSARESWGKSIAKSIAEQIRGKK